MEQKDEAIEYIQSISELNDSQKEKLIDRIKNGEPIDEVFETIEDEIQKRIDDIFDKADVKLDVEDPEYKAEEEKMMNEVRAAEKEFDTTMSAIEEETRQIKEDTSKGLDDIKMEEIRSRLTTAE